MQPVGFKSLM